MCDIIRRVGVVIVADDLEPFAADVVLQLQDEASDDPAVRGEADALSERTWQCSRILDRTPTEPTTVVY